MAWKKWVEHRPLLALAGMSLLGGCVAPHVVAPVAMAPAPVPPRPTPPGNMSATIALPEADANGGFITVNSGISPAEAAWNLRSALNVAALACRGDQEPVIVANYNSLLKAQKKPLAVALTTVQKRFKAEGSSWQDAHDRHMTRVYNFFAQPVAHEQFCAVALQVSAEAPMVAPAEFNAYAPTALARLEAPFTDYYRSYASYQRDLAAWDATYGGAPVPPMAVADIGSLVDWQPAPTVSANRFASR